MVFTFCRPSHQILFLVGLLRPEEKSGPKNCFFDLGGLSPEWSRTWKIIEKCCKICRSQHQYSSTLSGRFFLNFDFGPMFMHQFSKTAFFTTHENTSQEKRYVLLLAEKRIEAFKNERIKNMLPKIQMSVSMYIYFNWPICFLNFEFDLICYSLVVKDLICINP